jgi:NADPH:quinone reductase-like Zn-dependent oxidoreductase
MKALAVAARAGSDPRIHGAVPETEGGAFALQELDTDEPRLTEILVKIVASGICQTDDHAHDPTHAGAIAGGVGSRRRPSLVAIDIIGPAWGLRDLVAGASMTRFWNITSTRS